MDKLLGLNTCELKMIGLPWTRSHSVHTHSPLHISSFFEGKISLSLKYQSVFFWVLGRSTGSFSNTWVSRQHSLTIVLKKHLKDPNKPYQASFEGQHWRQKYSCSLPNLVSHPGGNHKAVKKGANLGLFSPLNRPLHFGSQTSSLGLCRPLLFLRGWGKGGEIGFLKQKKKPKINSVKYHFIVVFFSQSTKIEHNCVLKMKMLKLRK